MNKVCAAARDYMRTYRSMEYSIESRMEQLRRMRARLYGLTKELTDMPRGGSQADWTDLSAQCIEMEKDLADEIRLMRARQAEIRNAIALLPNERWQSVLNLRYIAGYGWDTVAMKMGLDSKYVIQLNREALGKIHVPMRDL